MIRLKDLLNESTNNGSASLNIIDWPNTLSLKWKVSNQQDTNDTIAKKFNFECEIKHPDSSLKGIKHKDSFVLAISKNSAGIYSLGKDIEKYSGISEKQTKADIKAGKETETDVIIYGLCNAMNGGKDIYFWNNGIRLAGAAKEVGVLQAVMEQLTHEAGVHLNRLILTRMIAKNNGVSIDNGDWITNDYGNGKLNWPAIGDIDKNAPIVKIDEETFATMAGAVVSMVMNEFIDMASVYIPEIKQINK